MLVLPEIQLVPGTRTSDFFTPAPCIGMHAIGLEFGSAAQLSKRPGSVWNCLWGNALKRSPETIRKSRVSYPGPGFLSSATWPSLPKKHYNGLNQIKSNPTLHAPLVLRPVCSGICHK